MKYLFLNFIAHLQVLFSKNPYWGYHLIFTATNCDEGLVQDEDHIQEFCKQLVKEIDMVPLTEPQTVYCDTKDRLKSGVTLYQIIETSNISAHYLDDGRCLFDVFSCKPFKTDDVLNLFNDYFSKTNQDVNFIYIKKLKRPA